MFKICMLNKQAEKGKQKLQKENQVSSINVE